MKKTASKKKTSVSPTLIAIIVEGFLTRLSFGVVTFALPLYARSLGLNLAQIGLLISLNMAIGTVLMPMMGRIADRFGLKQSYLAALGFHSLTALLLAFAVLPWHLYATRLAGGLSKSLRVPTANALVAEHGGKRSIASAFAWYSTARSSASAIGKALSGILITLTASNFSLLFGGVFFASFLPVLAVVFFVPSGEPKKIMGLPSKAIPDQKQVKRSRVNYIQLAPAMLFGFLVRGTGDMLRGLLPLLAVEYAGLSEAETGLLYLVTTVVVLLTGPVFGWLSDHVSRKLVLVLRGVSNVFASAIYLAFPTFSGFMAGKAIDTAGKAAFRPAWGALMAETAAKDQEKRALVMGVMGASEGAGAVAGPILGGLIWNTWGVTALLGARIGLALLTEIYALTWLSPASSLSSTDTKAEQSLDSS